MISSDKIKKIYFIFRQLIYKIPMKILKLTTLLIIVISVFSCSKYEEGPKFTLVGKTTRLCQKWRPIQYVDGNSGEILDIDSDGSFIEFLKDGSLQFKDVESFSQAGIDVAGGQWDFSEDKTQVTFNYIVSSVSLDVTQTCTITKLKINSLALVLNSNWVGYNSGDKIYYEYY